MSDKNLYYLLWRKYVHVIAVQMKNAINGPKEIKMSEVEFKNHGKRDKAGYVFTIEINDNKIMNNIRGLGVAKDLVDIIRENNACKALLKNRYYKFTMEKDYILNISVVNEEPATADISG